MTTTELLALASIVAAYAVLFTLNSIAPAEDRGEENMKVCASSVASTGGEAASDFEVASSLPAIDFGSSPALDGERDAIGRAERLGARKTQPNAALSCADAAARVTTLITNNPSNDSQSGEALDRAGVLSVPAIASAYGYYDETSCQTYTKLAPYRTLAMSTRFRKDNHFVYGDLFTIDAFPDVVWVLEDHLPAQYGRDLDLFLGSKEAAGKWGVETVMLTKVGHLEHPKGLYAKKEKFINDN